jgi:hypothetical protein
MKERQNQAAVACWPFTATHFSDFSFASFPPVSSPSEFASLDRPLSSSEVTLSSVSASMPVVLLSDPEDSLEEAEL